MLREGDTADQPYPFLAQDLDGNDTLVLSTDGEYSYVGRLVVDFDVNGNVIVDSIDEDVSGAFATTDETVASLYDGGLEEAFAEGTKGNQLGDLTGAVTGVVSEVDGNVFGETAMSSARRMSSSRAAANSCAPKRRRSAI